MVDKSKKAVKDALLETMYLKPFNQITVNELIEKAGISRGTFYAHFSNLEDVRQHLIEDLFAHADSLFADRKASDIAKNPYPTLLMAAEYISESIDPAKRLFKYFNVYELSINLRSWLADFILADEEFVTYLGGEAQAKIHAGFISGGIINAYYMWLNDEPPVSAELIAKTMSDILKACLKAAINSK